MSWAAKRRAIYLGGVTLFLFVVVGVPVFLLWYEQPTCFDGVQNQGELSIDRGGPCALLHESQVQPEVVLWARSFEVIPGVYNAVAYVSNPNFSAGVVAAPYSFKLFDAENILVAERKGVTYVIPNAITSVFEGGVATGNRVPARTFFEFLSPLEWERVDSPVKGLAVGDRELTEETSAPRITAEIKNNSFSDIHNIEVVATVFDEQDTAIASSRTAIESLQQQSSQIVVFTWPRPFTGVVSRIEIVPQAPFRE
ncbi:MAG: FxLYD domain-containing protein [Candidatus Pacebacteria bacterium]|nr:FxLYD domain-containing protein [Candidatus Paceibacterota bacterium]